MKCWASEGDLDAFRRVQTYARRRTDLPGLAGLGSSPRAGDLHRPAHSGVRDRPGRDRRLAHVRPGDLLVFAVLLLCIATTVELTKRAGENAGVIKDVWGVWELPIAILLPPVFALVAPLIQITLAQYRIRRIPVHRRVFSAAAVGLS